jgi:transglutaminase-like putative cysteine protease
VLKLQLSERAITAAAIGYVGFFPLDYLFLSQGFLDATVHLVFFLAVMKILTSRTNRDHLYTAVIAFLELLAAAILSVNLNFFVFLALFLVCGVAAFTSAEIRRSLQRPDVTARGGQRRLSSRLAALTAAMTIGVLGLTAGLFFMLPRTADAALRQLVSHRFYLPGFSNQVTLGAIGEVKASSTPVMRVRIFDRATLPNLKWRGASLSSFDGRRWFNAPDLAGRVRMDDNRVVLVDEQQRSRRGRRINYRVALNAIDTEALFFAGTPEVLSLRQRWLFRTSTGDLRLTHVPQHGFYYDVYSLLEDPSEVPVVPAQPLAPRERSRYLQLPRLDPRIAELARQVTAGASPDLNRARALERHLRSQYGYTIELPQQAATDPLADFLFQRKKGHCEYFASAMTVMLRSVGIPARLVNGFQSGTWNPISELYVIRASDAHSWVEAWLPGHGWTTFDPTPPDPNPRSLSLWAWLGMYTDAAQTFWQDWVLSYDLGRQATLADRVEQSGRRMGLRWFDGLKAATARWQPAAEEWLRGAAQWAVPLAALLAAGIWSGPMLVQGWRTRRGLRRLRRGEASIADATLLYVRMLHLLRRRGFRKPDWLTPSEFAATLPPSELGRQVRQFTAAYNALRFGGSAEAAPQLSLLLDRLKHQER